MRPTGILSGFAILVGVFLLAEGVWELSSPVVFGVLTSNTLHGAIHIVLGIVGIITGLRGGARKFLLFLGALLLIVDFLWFISPTNELIVRLLNVNKAVAILNLVVALVSLVLALSARETEINRH